MTQEESELSRILAGDFWSDKKELADAVTRQTVTHRFSKRGNGSNQTRMAFSVDNDLKPWLAAQPNKNRYINGLIRQNREQLCIQQEATRQGVTVGEHLSAMGEAYREKQQREAEVAARHRRPRKENPTQPLQD